MRYNYLKALPILERTPVVLHSLLDGLADEWVFSNEGDGTWTAFDVVGHLVVCEQTDFIPRADIILSGAATRILQPIDMTAQFETNHGKTMAQVLEEFDAARKESLQKLAALHLDAGDLEKTGVHPKIGQVTLSELLATWVVHDLNHLAQISRVMAKQYKDEVGAFTTYLRILK